MKYGFVYIWRDRKYKRYYIGGHWGREDDGYICGSVWMLKAYRKRPQDFKRRVLFKCNDKTVLWYKEYQYLSLIKEENLGEKYYNVSCFHYHETSSMKGKHLSEESKKKISKALKGKPRKPFTAETIEKIRLANIGKNNHNFGKHASEKTREKMSKSHAGENNINFGKHASEKTREKMSIAKKGKCCSDQHKHNISKSLLGNSYRKGKKDSDITKEKKRLARLAYIERSKNAK
jgi:hypothetical protein